MHYPGCGGGTFADLAALDQHLFEDSGFAAGGRDPVISQLGA